MPDAIPACQEVLIEFEFGQSGKEAAEAGCAPVSSAAHFDPTAEHFAESRIFVNRGLHGARALSGCLGER